MGALWRTGVGVQCPLSAEVMGARSELLEKLRQVNKMNIGEIQRGKADPNAIVDARSHCARHGDYRVGINLRPKMGNGGWEVFIKCRKVQVWSITSAAKKPVGKTLKDTVEYANSLAASRYSDTTERENVKVRKLKKKLSNKKPAAAPPMTPAIQEHVQQPGEEDQPAPRHTGH